MTITSQRSFGEDMLGNILDWVAKNVEPEAVYATDMDRLTDWVIGWALENGYVAEDRLDQWAEDNGYVAYPNG